MEREHYTLFKFTLYFMFFSFMFVLPRIMIFSQEKDQTPRKAPEMSIEVPTEGNSWVLTNVGTSQMQSEDFKNHNWISTDTVVRTYFYLESAGKLHIGFKGTVASDTTTIQATFQDETKEVELRESDSEIVYVGSFNVPSEGYYFVDLQRTEQRDKNPVPPTTLDFIVLGGDATSEGVRYSGKDYFYWGRRGPMATLYYEIPPSASDVYWFYSEVIVPEENDVIGSFYVANGFRNGYLGMQVESASERSILFRIWSPYKTDDPASIPAGQRVQLIAKGDQALAQDFGGEGSGGEGYLRFDWETGVTYRFLTKGEPIGDNKTDYSAYFFDPKAGKWHFIAQWRRPATASSLTDLYSFLENFLTESGPIERTAYYSNQWVYDTNLTWHEITNALFSATFYEIRLDYGGGYRTGDNGFYLRNCGFFNNTVEVNTQHTRPRLDRTPNIDFDALPRH